MKRRIQAGRVVAGLLLMAAAACRGVADTERPVAGESAGRVLVREGEAGRYRGRATPGLELHAADTVLTGPGARVEWRVGARGRWRVGERAVWIAGPEGGDAELRAGTALAAVPGGERWTVGAADARVRLGEGVWLLTAVDNEGLKIVALDGGVVENASQDAGAPSEAPAKEGDGVPPGLRLRAGEVVFARPGGTGFGPVVTIFLDELLVSSRLITRFGEELPQMERLRQQGAAQRERLSLVSNAHVGGAKDAEGFQVIVPGKRADTGAAEGEATQGRE